VRNYCGVTGACMMTPANVYREVGGFSEELAVSYNDADYCLKVRRKGLWAVYAPSVELIHMESQSRVASADMDEVAWYHKRWAAEIVSDQFYNERFLTVASPTFEPCINQRML
jgi:GT2 family glycosyltransferase